MATATTTRRGLRLPVAEFDRSQLTALVGADGFFPGLDAVLSAFDARPSRGGVPSG
jgi:hypothetical protein